jgi:cytidylate kinase
VTRELPEVALPCGSRVIADLHLDPRNAAGWEAFARFLDACAGAPALLVLGDLFEYWIGPAQAREPEYAQLLARIAARVRAGTAVHVLHGNRDFLLGAAFERATLARVHPTGLVGRGDDGARTLFLHGDELATRDVAYQRLRKVLRSPVVRGLAQVVPAPAARGVARALRKRSRTAVAGKQAAYVALQRDAAEAWCAASRSARLVCGHAHRFRDEALAGGGRWIVLDAFGGARDVLAIGPAGELVPGGSGERRLRSPASSLSSSATMIIALDGPAGVGKSSVARALARALGAFFLDTGAMYRAVTLAVLERGVEPADAAACGRIARELGLDFDARGEVLVDGRPGEPAIRSAAVTGAVSQVSAHPEVRAAVVARQRELAAAHGKVVAEGRDTATVVFPDADHKFYLDASPAERARRRAAQEGELPRLAEIQQDMERRDRFDSSREHAPLRVAHGAAHIDTDGLDLDQVVGRILARVRGESGEGA